jgi:murein DD-endopeptidase MepM/ murein hydrolase activator NlpD
MRLGRLRSLVNGSAVPSRGESWSLEVQIHPSDIRRRVRYLFISRGQLTAWSVLALVYLAGLALGVAVAPSVVHGFLNRQEYQALTAERTRQGERTESLVDRLDRLDSRLADLDLQMAKVFLAYGLPPAAAPGRPSARPAEPAVESIYARAIDRGDRLRTQMRARLTMLGGALRDVHTFETAHPEQVQTTPSVCPLRGELVLVSSFGIRRSPFTRQLEFHSGADLAAPLETPVYATADGEVTFAGQYPLTRSPVWWRYGNLVIVEHGSDFVTVFGHNSQVLVRAGQKVKRGDLLATVGDSGRSTSPHLHYEVRRLGPDDVYRPIDPLIYILDHRWPNEERLVVRARSAPPVRDFEPLPPRFSGGSGRSRGRKFR